MHIWRHLRTNSAIAWTTSTHRPNIDYDEGRRCTIHNTYILCCHPAYAIEICICRYTLYCSLLVFVLVLVLVFALVFAFECDKQHECKEETEETEEIEEFEGVSSHCATGKVLHGRSLANNKELFEVLHHPSPGVNEVYSILPTHNASYR